MVYIAWALSLVITLAAAEKLHVKRLPVLYCYVGRLPFAFAEVFWYAIIFERIEREAWSLNSANNGSNFSAYELMNKYPSLLFGLRRGVLVLCAAIAFLCLGTIGHERKWALWFGISILYEFALRTVFYMSWSWLPRIYAARSWIERILGFLFPMFLSKVMKGRERLRVSHERVPFHEQEVEPFESWSKVWGFYMAFFRNLV